MNDQRQLQVKLARTGIEQPYMRDRPRFIETHREFERVANVNVSYYLSITCRTFQDTKFEFFRMTFITSFAGPALARV